MDLVNSGYSGGARYLPSRHKHFVRFASHLGIDFQVGFPGDAGEFFQDEEVRAIADQPDPVARQDEVGFLLGQAVLLAGGAFVI
jgi:hypothetical protein